MPFVRLETLWNDKKKKRSCFEVIPLDEGFDGHKFSCFDLSQLIDSTHSAILVPLTFQ